MSWRRASLILALILPAAIGAGLRVPPISGQLAGDLKPLQLAGAPELHWTLALSVRDREERAGVFLAEAPGSRLKIGLEVNAAGDGTWRVEEGRAELKAWLNGLFNAGTAEIAGEGQLKDGVLAGEFRLTLKDVDLGELMNFADADHAYVKSAQGRVEGTIGIRLRDGKVAAGEARLTLPAGTVGVVSFVPSPGLLSSFVPEQVLKLYPGIRAIELGQTPLEAKVLRLSFHPEGDGQGRGALLRIEGRPLDPKLIAPIELDVNFTGPLESFVRKTFDSRLKIGGVR